MVVPTEIARLNHFVNFVFYFWMYLNGVSVWERSLQCLNTTVKGPGYSFHVSDSCFLLVKCLVL